MHMLFFNIVCVFLLVACDKTDASKTNSRAISSVAVAKKDKIKPNEVELGEVESGEVESGEVDLGKVKTHKVLQDDLKKNIIKDGYYCFSKVFNKDVTDVQIHIDGNNVTGKMNWLPYQKDSARGTLKGELNAARELELLYDYMIEGNRQTETKVMKIENEKLMMKVGELLDPNNDGHLIYKDVEKAKFSEVLETTDCKNFSHDKVIN